MLASLSRAIQTTPVTTEIMTNVRVLVSDVLKCFVEHYRHLYLSHIAAMYQEAKRFSLYDIPSYALSPDS